MTHDSHLTLPQPLPLVPCVVHVCREIRWEMTANDQQFPVNGLDLSPYVVKDPGGTGGGGGQSAGKDPTHLRRQQQQQQQQPLRPPGEADTNSIASPRTGAVVGAIVRAAEVGGAVDVAATAAAAAAAAHDGVGVGVGGVKGDSGAFPSAATDPSAYQGGGSDGAGASLLPNGGAGISGRDLPNGLPAPAAPTDAGGGGGGGGVEATDREGEPLLPPGAGVAAGAVEADTGGGATGEGDGDGGGGGAGLAGAGVIGADVREIQRLARSLVPKAGFSPRALLELC